MFFFFEQDLLLFKVFSAIVEKKLLKSLEILMGSSIFSPSTVIKGISEQCLSVDFLSPFMTSHIVLLLLSALSTCSALISSLRIFNFWLYCLLSENAFCLSSSLPDKIYISCALRKLSFKSLASLS